MRFAFTTTLSREVVVTEAKLPSEARAGEWVEDGLKGHVTTSVTNPGLGIAYVGGPADSIGLKVGAKETRIEKNTLVGGYVSGTYSTCTTLYFTEPIYLKFPQGGEYALRFCAFKTPDGRRAEITDYRELKIAVKGVGIAELLKQYWLPIAVVGGVAFIGAAVLARR